MERRKSSVRGKGEHVFRIISEGDSRETVPPSIVPPA
jgi:hypothetical protein